jgi:hypothetical protein
MKLRLLSKLFLAALNESKRNFLAKQFKLTPEKVESISNYDPSPNNAYSAWLCKVYRDMGAEGAGQLSKYTEPLKKFMKLMNSPDFPKDKRDIGKYTASDLMDLVGSERRMRHNLSEREIERQIMNEGLPGAKVVWKGGGFQMWAVTNARYARFLSSSTSWCTAQPDYSTRYTTSGTLYPIYYLGKPFIQGYIEHKGSGIEFLDVKDNHVNFKDPIVLQMFDTIKMPQLATFCKYKLGKDEVYNIIEGNNVDEETLSKLRDLLFDTDNIMGIQGYLISDSSDELWEDGYEILLDFPQIMLRTIKSVPTGTLLKLKNEYPELAHDIAIEISTAGNNDRNLPGIIMTLMGDKHGLSLIPSLVTSCMEQGTPLNETITNNPTFLAKVIEVVTNKIKSMEERSSNVAEFLEYNKEIEPLKPCILQYWRKFVKKQWSELGDVLNDVPEYQERVELVKPFPRSLRVGARVTLGPDYQGDIPAGSIGEIVEIDSPKITAKFEGGKLEDFIYDWRNGEFQLIPYFDQTEKWVVMDPLPERLEVGQKVVIGPDWREDERSPTDYAVVEKEKEGDGGQLVYIRFDSTPDTLYGGFYYIPGNTVRVVPVELVKPKVELPEQLARGTRIKRGPTWRWGNQDQGGLGEIAGPTGMRGWINVTWDTGSNNNYRYGPDQADHDEVPEGFGPFIMDVIPEEMDLSQEVAKELSWTMAGKTPPQPVAPNPDGIPF